MVVAAGVLKGVGTWQKQGCGGGGLARKGESAAELLGPSFLKYLHF